MLEYVLSGAVIPLFRIIKCALESMSAAFLVEAIFGNVFHLNCSLACSDAAGVRATSVGGVNKDVVADIASTIAGMEHIVHFERRVGSLSHKRATRTMCGLATTSPFPL